MLEQGMQTATWPHGLFLASVISVVLIISSVAEFWFTYLCTSIAISNTH